MTKESMAFIAITSGLVALLLVIVGTAMWKDSPMPAEEAVGRGVVTMGAAAAIVALCAVGNLMRLQDQEALRTSRAEADQESE